MNFNLPYIPERTTKPRTAGITMMMDKGLSLRQAEDFAEMNAHITDFVKLGFGSALITKNLKEKIKIYQNAGIRVYLGGTLFEAFLIRNKFEEYIKLLDDLNLDLAEISDGSIVIPHEYKCELIHKLSQHVTVLSEVGSKEEGILISPNRWITMMKNELSAGSWKVIAEARESGTVGIYRPNGTAHTALINKILKNVNKDDIIWEAPKKNQQVWFIKLLGANVNLGNIAPNELIPLECLRLGLRGDTFFEHVPQELIEEFKAQVTQE